MSNSATFVYNAYELGKTYEYKKRFYHDWSHISDCIQKLHAWPNLPQTYYVALYDALVWHDIVYDAKSKTNEVDSATLYMTFNASYEKPSHAHQVYRLIMLTAGHDVDKKDVIGSIMVAIDLSGLGADWHTFSRNTENIRKEYYMYSDEEFAAGRLGFFKTMLAKERIFVHPYAFEQWEANARENMERAVKNLEGTV